MIKRDEILSFLKENKDNLFNEYHLTKLGLFGSLAKDKETENSEIDLIVEFEPNTTNLTEKKSKIRNLISNLCLKICNRYFLHYIRILPHHRKDDHQNHKEKIL